MSLLVPLALAAILALLGLRGMEERARAQGFGWIDPAALVVGELPPWADPRWGEELDAVLRELPAFPTEDVRSREDLCAEIEALSFVAAARIEAVLWPDGLALDVVLREPVACVPTGRHFQPVAADGTLLTGRWSAPPLVHGAPLPVIGPMEDARGLFQLARAGDYLVEPEHLDALDVAVSLEAHLPAPTRARLGRVVIDARRAREASVEEPGIRLLLEGGRMVLFGRAPSAGEPGELPAAAKWSSLEEALALEECRGGIDGTWDLLDLRWDVPEIVLRHPPVAALGESARTARAASAVPARRRPPRERAWDDRPRVR